MSATIRGSVIEVCDYPSEEPTTYIELRLGCGKVRSLLAATDESAGQIDLGDTCTVRVQDHKLIVEWDASYRVSGDWPRRLVLRQMHVGHPGLIPPQDSRSRRRLSALGRCLELITVVVILEYLLFLLLCRIFSP